jgi:hypothetical protein
MDVRVRNMVITLSVAALATLTVTQTASAAGTDVLGLWSSTYTATPTNCGTYSSDANSFCWTQGGDGNPAGVELGVKFTSSQALNIFQPGYPQVTTVSCNTSLPTDVIETTVTAGSSSLQYDPTADQYSYVWKTNSSWAGTCVQFDLGLNDGSTHTFLVEFKK